MSLYIHNINCNEIVATTSYPLYSTVCGWTSADDLSAGDMLVLSNSRYVVVEKVQHEIFEKPVKVYIFEVADFHSYYVTATGVLVHNADYNNNTKHLKILVRLAKNPLSVVQDRSKILMCLASMILLVQKRESSQRGHRM